jgi:hypothetical protein
MWNKIKGAKWTILVIAIIVVVLTTVTVLAATGWPGVNHSVPGSGTINVISTTTTTTTSIVTPSSYDFQINPTTSPVDFNGSVAAGNTYTATIEIPFENISAAGTDGKDLTLHSLSASATGLPGGWSLSGTWSGTLAAGTSSSIEVTLTSPANLQSTTVLPSFTIVLTANS